MDCLSGLTDSLNKKERAQEESREKFDEQIIRPFKQLQDSQRKHMKDLPVQQEHHKDNVNRQWKVLKRTLMSERSPWGSRCVFVVFIVVVVVVVATAVCCYFCWLRLLLLLLVVVGCYCCLLSVYPLLFFSVVSCCC